MAYQYQSGFTEVNMLTKLLPCEYNWGYSLISTSKKQPYIKTHKVKKKIEKKRYLCKPYKPW